MQYELEGRHHFKVVLPKNELIVALLDGAEEFLKVWRSILKVNVIINMKLIRLLR